MESTDYNFFIFVPVFLALRSSSIKVELNNMIIVTPMGATFID